MSTETPEREQYTIPTPEAVATVLAGVSEDYEASSAFWPEVTANGPVLEIDVTPYNVAGFMQTEAKTGFRAVVVEGETAPLVLQEPAELGMSWPDGGDLLTLTDRGIKFYPRGVDEWGLDPDEALELAAQLAAMAHARKAASGGEDQ